MNTEITVNSLRLVGEDGEKIGIVSKNDAIQLSKERGLDIVLVTDKADPPVYKLVNLDKYRYEQKKREKELAKKSRQSQIKTKEIKLRPVISDHDLGIKIKQITKFIEQGNKVKIVVQLRGREHSEPAYDVVHRVGEMLSDIAEFEGKVQGHGRRIIGTLIHRKE